MNKYKLLLSALLVILILVPGAPASAQEEVPSGPTYIVQDGDTLGLIALRFGVSIDELMSANNITDSNAISLGAPLIIPGLEGISGVMVTRPVNLGETLESLALRDQVPMEIISRLNRLTSPLEVYVGSNIILPQNEDTTPAVPFAAVGANQSLLELSMLSNNNPWELVLVNQLDGTWDVIPGQVLYHLDGEAAGSSITPYIDSLNISSLPLTQGATITISVETFQPIELSGHLGDHTLNFFPNGEGSYIAFQGVHAQQPLGLTSFALTGSMNNQPLFAFEQMLLVKSGLYGTESLIVDPSFLDLDVIESEDQLILALVNSASPNRYWTENFICPVDPPACIKSWYGTRRTYNEGLYKGFHTGVDYGVCATKNIYVPASGVVVYTGLLHVRGNTTYIDHGWGLYSGIFHQEEILVQVGEQVEAGQLVGIIGNTGRVTGPHLHYELWVNGVQVQPLDWLDENCQ